MAGFQTVNIKRIASLFIAGIDVDGGVLLLTAVEFKLFFEIARFKKTLITPAKAGAQWRFSNYLWNLLLKKLAVC